MALSDSFIKREFSEGRELEEQRKAALLEEMGVTEYEVDKLRRMMLSAKEAVCAKEEELTRIRQHKGRRDYWWEFTDAKSRMGVVMHHSDIIYRLKKLIPGLIVCQGGQRGCVGLYAIRNAPTAEIPGYPLTANGMSYTDVPVYLGWIHEGWSPEYEIDIVNEVGVAIGQKRGWRTLLLRLICRRDDLGRRAPIVSEEKAVSAFGHPSAGATASHYRRRLWVWRNGHDWSPRPGKQSVAL